ncbi:hypothetical protein ALCH109712_09330 [Alkalicoccus chagannorensis]
MFCVVVSVGRCFVSGWRSEGCGEQVRTIGGGCDHAGGKCGQLEPIVTKCGESADNCLFRGEGSRPIIKRLCSSQVRPIGGDCDQAGEKCGQLELIVTKRSESADNCLFRGEGSRPIIKRLGSSQVRPIGGDCDQAGGKCGQLGPIVTKRGESADNSRLRASRLGFRRAAALAHQEVDCCSRASSIASMFSIMREG